jgi:hypothetical protein
MALDLRSMRRVALWVTSVLILMGSGAGSPDGQQASKISGIVIGHYGFVWYDPFRILFHRDPIFTYTLYPLPPDLGDDDKRKLDRVYYPRTGELLEETYDIMIFTDARIQHFTSRQFHDLDHAFREAGMASVMVFLGSFLWDWVWEPSILREVAPISRHEKARYDGFRVEFNRQRDPVFLPFLGYGIEEVVGNAVAEMQVKQGATVWGTIRPQNQPWMASWKPGGGDPGMQWTLLQFYLEGWWDEDNNPYALDVATNMIFYSLGMDLISDIPARREARRLFSEFQLQKSAILSMMEWADSFGADTLTLSDRVRDLEGKMEDGVTDYAAQDYAATISFLESMRATVSEISEEAVRLKDDALFWVHLVEWLVITSAAIISGAAVWTLMIRRSMYRATATTRLRRMY